MPKSILMYPDAGTLAGEDLLYLVKGAGGSDRDRKVSLGLIREFCTAQGVRLMEATLAAPGAITTVDVSGTTNVVLIAWGRFPNPTDTRLNITGTIPEGCSVVVLNGHLGILDLRVHGTAPTTTPEDLDFGTYGRAEMVSRGGAFVVSVVNDSRWNRMRLGEETTRAENSESALADLVSAEQTRAEAAEAALQAAGGVSEVRKFPIRFIVLRDPAYADGPDHVVTPLFNNGPVPSSDVAVLMYNDAATALDSRSIVQTPKLKVYHETANDRWLYPPSGNPAYLTGTSCGMKSFAAAAPGYNAGTGSERVNVVTWSPNLGDIILASGRSDDNGHMFLGLLLPHGAEGIPAGTMEEFFFRVRCEGRSVIGGGGNFGLEISVMDPTLYTTHGWAVYLAPEAMSAGLRDVITIRARRTYLSALGYTNPVKVDFWSESNL